MGPVSEFQETGDGLFGKLGGFLINANSGRLVAIGESNRQIAKELVLSVRTVERHVTNIYAKIYARGRADATARPLPASA